MRRIKMILTVLTTVALLASTALAWAEEPKKASFRPHWVPQAQFAGYYTALAKGFYKEAGIDMEIRPGGPGISALNNVAMGRDTFCSEWLISALSLASKGAPLVNIAQMLQTGGLMLVTFKKTGIDDPKQMDGRTVGVWPGPFAIAPTVLFEQLGVRPKLHSQKFSIDEFLNGQVDVASAMIYNEYHLILESGVNPSDLNTFFFRDHGLNFPEDGIYVHAETVKKDPELCRGFVKASIKGWLYAFEHPEEAVSIVMAAANEAKTGTSPRHQATMLQEIEKMMLFRVTPELIGELDPKDFRFVHDVLQSHKLMARPVELDSFHVPMAR
jgi:NitT/TauT family transport system substrate-binding protein